MDKVSPLLTWFPALFAVHYKFPKHSRTSKKERQNPEQRPLNPFHSRAKAQLG
jgi:hypothetical protein